MEKETIKRISDLEEVLISWREGAFSEKDFYLAMMEAMNRTAKALKMEFALLFVKKNQEK